MVQGDGSGATAQQVPAQMESFILTNEVSKTSHFQSYFCNVFSWRNTVIAHKLVFLSSYS